MSESTNTDIQANEIAAAHGAMDKMALRHRFFTAVMNRKMRRLEQQDPREAVMQLLSELPQAPATYHRKEIEGREHLVDSDMPTDLEQYFVLKAVRGNLNSMQFENGRGPAGDRFPIEDSIVCLRDAVRTKKFTESVIASVKKIQSFRDAKNDSTPIEVLDAGSGAVPIMAIVAALTSPHVRCTCIESSPNAVQFSRHLVKSLNLEDRITILHSDARKYVPPNNIDILVSETMDAGMTNEPMRDILDHLRVFVSGVGIIIPSEIETYATSIPLKTYEDSEEYIHIYGEPTKIINDASWIKTGALVPHHKRHRDMRTISGSVDGSTQTGEERVILFRSRVVLPGDGNKNIVLDFDQSKITETRCISTGHNKATWESIPKTYTTKPGSDLGIFYKTGDTRIGVRELKQHTGMDEVRSLVRDALRKLGI